MKANTLHRDQLYFDRIHPSVPILHQRQYLSWSGKPKAKHTSRACLQHAMWTLASLVSAQFQHLQKSLYRETKQMLEAWSLGGNGKTPIETEQVQAWILVATYESMRTYHQQAWMSAGRAFRLVQLMRLHEIDSPPNSARNGSDFIKTEEKRRVFWMAYFLDHLFSMRNNWPITLNEHVVSSEHTPLTIKMRNCTYIGFRSARASLPPMRTSKIVSLCWGAFSLKLSPRLALVYHPPSTRA